MTPAEAEAAAEAVADPAAAATADPGTGTYEAAGEEDELGTGVYVLGGLALLAAALTAGFFAYRRRLP